MNRTYGLKTDSKHNTVRYKSMRCQETISYRCIYYLTYHLTITLTTASISLTLCQVRHVHSQRDQAPLPTV